ncbi:uncharacterized protein DUF4184 [Micromonospora pisi]|uniref:Uncharacterized protein DUF4184 n=1 Tax=Micromonospora pisi TaxID=589240 RepID=A0A495JM79_9ACTN|nr:DUF4184 family protein [Micromonospora pisi]RKR89442.1 uncharacterized protein DUF4184 [Micromonospora pisi]
MPMTLPTHPVAVVPLKMWRPRWFDGVALVIGAASPDVAFAMDGYGVTIHSHAWHAPLWWALPLTLVASRLVRWSAPVVATHLPSGGPLALRDYGVLGAVRHRWWVTVISALLGAISHIGWDAFTHPTVDTGLVLFPALHQQVIPGLPWWELLSIVSNVLGAVVGVVLLLRLGRDGLLRAWHGPAPVRPRHPAAFWSAVIAVLIVGGVLLPLQPVRYPHDQAIRCMVAIWVALLTGAFAAAASSRFPVRRPRHCRRHYN